MSKAPSLLFVWILVCFGINAQVSYYDLSIVDDVRLGGSLNEELTDIIATSNDEYLVSGISHSSSWENYITVNYGFEDIWLVGLDENLDIVSSNIHGTSGNERVNTVVECADGGFAMCGYIQTGVPPQLFNEAYELDLKGDFDLLLMKVDAQGELLWVKNFGGSEKDWGYDLMELGNGDLLVTGYTESIDGDVSINNGKEDLWLLRTDATGELIWEKTFGGSDHERGRSLIFKESDVPESDDVWIVGSSKSDDGDVSENFGTLDVWLISVAISSGTLNWEKNYGSSDGDTGLKILSLETGAIICGQTKGAIGNETSYGADDAFVMTVDDFGNLLQSKNIGGVNTDLLSDMVHSGTYFDGDVGTNTVYYLSGYTFSSGTNGDPFNISYQEENAWIIAYELEENMIRNLGLFGGNDEDQGVALAINNDYQAICAGFTKSVDGDLAKHGAHDGWVFKFYNPNSIGISENKTITLTLGPNPAHDVLRFSTSLDSYTYALFDLNGKSAFQSSKQFSAFGSNELNISNLSSGIYFLEVCDGAECLRKKVLKQ